MSAAAIQAQGLSKRYTIGRAQQRQDTLRDALAEGMRRAGKRGENPGPSSTIWALKDVSFEIGYGEAVGIIGRNGAGKSTLLKILSQITEPTSGRAVVEGRVGSLLEVGTGFHQELTGRENISLNGAILGMSRKEIAARFDEIVAFAEIEQFLDMPVKRYSSGMYVRLAFAVAAHLEPEILLVDEVLAVGDIEFQKKCLGKMGDVASAGRTVLFVSHNLNAIQRLCRRTMLIEGGRLAAFEGTQTAVAQYLAGGQAYEKPETWIDLRPGRGLEGAKAYFKEAWYSAHSPASANRPYPDGPVEFRLRIESEVRRTVSSLAVTLYDPYGVKLVNADTLSLGRAIELKGGTNEVRLTIERLHLNPGSYTVGLWLANLGNVFDRLDGALTVEVADLAEENLGGRAWSDGLVTSPFTIEVV